MTGLREYGVLKGRVVGFDETHSRHDFHSPHFYVYVKAQGIRYKVFVNVRSSKHIYLKGSRVPNELLYIAESDFQSDQITHLQKLGEGYYPIKKHNEFITVNYGCNPGEIAVDYVRSRLFNPCEMKIYKNDKPNPDNDLTDFLTNHIKKAQSKGAIIYVYGERFQDESGASCIHDVHMNQGSHAHTEIEDEKALKCSDGVYQDGCILIEYSGHWEAVFLAFQSQSWCTDEIYGHKLEDCYIFNHKTKKFVCDLERWNKRHT